MSEQNRIGFQEFVRSKFDWISQSNKDFIEIGWNAATAEANKRIAELESEVAELKDAKQDLEKEVIHLQEMNEPLQASNHDLREALKLFKKEAESYGETWARCYVADFDRIAVDSKKVRFDLLAIQQDRLKSFADALLSATPAESLQAFENEVSQCKIDAERYQFVRKLTPREFAEIYDINIKTGVHFDHLISQALKEVK